MKKQCLRGAIGFVIFLLAACGSSNSLGPASRAEQHELIEQAALISTQIQSGDKINIMVFGEDRLSGTYVVDPAGNVSVPLVGTVKADGLTQNQFAQVLERKLASQYLRDPKVTVEITAFRPFFILGQVKTPGQYPYEAGLNVLSGIAIAGGTTYRANESMVLIEHAGEAGFHEYPMSPTIPLLPGDVIRVPQRYF